MFGSHVGRSLNVRFVVRLVTIPVIVQVYEICTFYTLMYATLNPLYTLQSSLYYLSRSLYFLSRTTHSHLPSVICQPAIIVGLGRESGHGLCSNSTLVPFPSPLCLSTKLENSTMSTPGSKKRLRETTSSELLPKRKKLTPNLQLLYDEVKEKCQLLDAELLELLDILPTNESTADGRIYTTEVQNLLKSITTTGEVRREIASVFDADFGTVFPDEIITQLIPRE